MAFPARKRHVGLRLWQARALICLSSAIPLAPLVAAETPANSDTESLEMVDVQEQPQAPAELVSRLEAQLAFDRLVDQEHYQEALPVGEQLVKLTSGEFGEGSRETAEALEKVADVQRRLGEHQAAEATFLKAIEVIRATEGTFSRFLVDPLVGLGSNYQDTGDYVNALAAFNEARSVSRRVFGLLDERQVPILDKMTETLYSMDRYAEADEQQLAALHLAERNHGEDSPDILDAIYKYAAWLRTSGRFQEERVQYSRAMDIIRESFGEDSAKLAEPLRQTGNSFRLQRIGEGLGSNALSQALNVLEAQDDPDPLAVAKVLRDMGDWQVAFSKTGSGEEQYVRAWELLGRVDNGDRLRKEWFSGPEYVLREPVSQRGVDNGPGSQDGYVLVRFDVDERGRTANVEVLKSEPEGLKDEAVLRAVQRSRFRPQMDGGEVVPGKGLALRFTFRYMPDEKKN